MRESLVEGQRQVERNKEEVLTLVVVLLFRRHRGLSAPDILREQVLSGTGVRALERKDPKLEMSSRDSRP